MLVHPEGSNPFISQFSVQEIERFTCHTIRYMYVHCAIPCDSDFMKARMNLSIYLFFASSSISHTLSASFHTIQLDYYCCPL